MLFAVMMSKPEEDDDCSNTDNENTVLTSATQTLDLLAMHLPPEKLIPHLVSFRIFFYYIRFIDYNIYYYIQFYYNLII